MKPRQFVGLAILLAVVLAVGAYVLWPAADPGPAPPNR